MSPSVFTIPADRAFADALVAGVLAEMRGDPLALARSMILAPSNRAARAIRDAFVRAAEPALLLPRLVTVGEADLEEAAGLVFDAAEADPVPPAIDPLARRILLARLIEEEGAFGLERINAALAFRLAGDLARVLDALTVERNSLSTLTDEGLTQELSEHWQVSFDTLRRVESRYRAALELRGLIDLAVRRDRLLARTARHWQEAPPANRVIAAGITSAAPAVAELLRTVARLPKGQVVLPGFDPALPANHWEAIRGSDSERAEESHPHYHLGLLLERMGVAPGEVQLWQAGTSRGDPTRQRLIADAMAPARFTGQWQARSKVKPLLPGVAVHRFANPADEAQGIAIALRGALEVPQRTAALVTPDRALAARVAGHLRRWGIMADDSAGKPLSATLAGGLMQALARVVAERFAPAALLGLLKHPLVHAGETRLGWLEAARWMDMSLRGPRPAPGLAGVAERLAPGDRRDPPAQALARDWWREQAPRFAPLEALSARAQIAPGEGIATLRAVAENLAGEALWSAADGRALSSLIEGYEELAPQGPQYLPREALPDLVRDLLDTQSVRPAWGGHHRLFIWGLLEARLQSADVMILGGLNEGSWPQLPSADPFLAPRMRRELGLPGLEYRIGLSALDFTLALGAEQVIITRAARDASAPTVESRFLLRLSARATPEQAGLDLPALAQAIDKPEAPATRAPRPEPAPPASERPRKLSVTEADTLVQDPYAFYARKMLRLNALDALEDEANPRWRGVMLHKVLEDWAREDGFAPGKLVPRLEAELQKPEVDPALRAFGLPRMREALFWVERQMREQGADGRSPELVEAYGSIELAGITLGGKPDRIDRTPEGGLAIVDYKTGSSPTKKAVEQGFALQLGLLGAMAEAGGFKGLSGEAVAFEYWRLNKSQKTGDLGWLDRVSLKEELSPVDVAVARLEEAVAEYLTGDAPFTARLHPQFTGYGDYDQLMRLEEWYGPQG